MHEAASRRFSFGTLRRIGKGLALTLLLATLTGQLCAPADDSTDDTPVPDTHAQPRVRIETNKGAIVLELFDRQAPQSVANFLQYVGDGFYNGIIFHEVVEGDFVVAGTYDEELTTRETRDPVPNESNNGLSNTRGRVAMIEPDGVGTGTGTSAFLIHLADSRSDDFNLDTGDLGLTVFGEVVEGMDIVEAIAGVDTTSQDTSDGDTLDNVPVEPIIILSAAVDTGTGPNTPPVAEAGPDQSAQLNQVVSLDGSASTDADGDDLAFRWSQTSGPAVTLSRTDVIRPNFAANTVAVLIFELIVTDSRGATATDTVTVTVSSSDNNPPVAAAGADQTVQTGQAVALDGSASSDPDGQALSFAWTQTGGTPVVLTNPSTAGPTFTAPAVGGALTFELAITDALGGVATDTVIITVNQAPSASAGADRNIFAGINATLRGSGTDPDVGNTLSFSWQQTAGPAVALSSPTAAQPTFTVPAGLDALSFELTVNDGRGGAATDTVTLTPVSEPFVRLRTTQGDIVLDMLETEAPITVKNFLEYVDSGFYDGTIFHRVINTPDPFVIQGGGFLPDLSAKSGVRDPIQNEFSPTRSNVRATVAMAKRGNDPNSATSQFFINLADNSSNLDNQNGGFTVFARVIEGMDTVVTAIAEAPTSTQSSPDGDEFQDVPIEDVIVNAATIE